MSTLRKFLFFFALAVIVVRPSIAADSLVVSPQNPTIMDSIRLSILAIDWSCCTQFSYDSTVVVLVNDSTIALSFTAQVIVCPCPSNPVAPVLTYKRGPLPARKYSVYEQYQSCTGQVCSDLVVQAFIGTFRVSVPTATVFHQKPVPLESIGKISANGRVYDIRGALVSPDRINASKRSPGVYFIKPDERSAAQLKIWY